MSSNFLKNTAILSTRSRNVCISNNLTTDAKLLDYYNIYKTFSDLKHCGRKTNEELIAYCIELNAESQITLTNPKVDDFGIIVSNLTRIQRDVINSFIHINTLNLSIRSRNAISRFSGYNFKIKNYTDKVFLSKTFDLNNIKNIGKTSIPEIEVYLEIIKEYTLKISKEIDEEYLIQLKNNFLIQKTYSITKIPKEISQSESIFKLTNFLLESNAFFNQTQTPIIGESLKIYNKEELSLDEIAEKNLFTRERVRQIRNAALDELFNKIIFIKNFNDDLWQKYGIDSTKTYIEISDTTTNKINARNETNFSKEFITYILYVYLNEDFSIIGNIEDVLIPKFFNARNRHNWKNLYLVNNKLSTEFDFDSFANDIKKRIGAKINETYSFNFYGYLSKFIEDDAVGSIENIYPIAEMIINDEFDLYLDIEDNITFERNTVMQVYEYAYKALEELGAPSKVEIIFEKVKELFPNYETEEHKIRVSMKRKDGFTPIGRSSTFGLTEWENNIDSFKGGTIRSIAVEYLEKFNTPKHITDITSYILMYRPDSNEKSVYYNLKQDESEDFKFFKRAYIGLRAKQYPIEYEGLDESNPQIRLLWEDRYKHLKLFVNSFNRLPQSSSCSEEEARLYRWVNVQKRRIIDDELEQEKEILLTRILEQHLN